MMMSDCGTLEKGEERRGGQTLTSLLNRSILYLPAAAAAGMGKGRDEADAADAAAWGESPQMFFSVHDLCEAAKV